MRFILTILLTTFLTYAENYGDEGVDFQKPDGTKTYVCPPCGCEGDFIAFGHPGICSHCKMSLIEGPTGLKKEVADIFNPLLRNRSGKFYSKFIYPSFFLSFFLGLLMCFKFLRKGEGNPYLSVLFIILALYGFKNQLFGTNYALTNDFSFVFFPISFIYLIGPLSYFCVRSYLFSNFQSPNSSKIYHFLPAGIIGVLYLVLFLISEQNQSRFMFSPFDSYIGLAEQLIAIVVSIPYLLIAFTHIRSWRRSHSLEVKNKAFLWSRRLVYSTSLLLVIWACLIIMNYWVYEMGVSTLTLYPLWFFYAVYLYWNSLEVFFNPKLFCITKYRDLTNGNLKITAEDLAGLKKKVLRTMTMEKPYLDPNLDLQKLAEIVEIRPKLLSKVLNSFMKCKFYDFIDEYRVEDAKRMLANPDLKNLTIETICHRAGFKSKSTFYKKFKKNTGNNPSYYFKNGI